MNSEEYIDQVNQLINLQNNYVQIFIALIALIIGFIGYLQWRISQNQIEKLKEKTKKETVKEIEKALGVSSLDKFKKDIHRKIDNVEKGYSELGLKQIDYELTKIYNEDEPSLWHLECLMDVYKGIILKDIKAFNYFVSKIDDLLSGTYNDKKIDIHSRNIDNTINKLSEFENEFIEKSQELYRLKSLISYYRSEKKDSTI